MNNMNKLQIFENEKLGKIRTRVINNEPYFCLKDICEILGLKNPMNVLKRLKENGVYKIYVGVNTGLAVQDIAMNFINESNLYKCIFRSNKKEAEEFTDWVTEDVLPTIRKTGMYANQKLLLTPSEMRLKIRYYDSKSKVFNSINRLLNNDHMTEELRNALTGNIKDIISNDDNLIQTRAQRDNEEWDRNDLTDKLREFVKTYGVKDRPTKEAYEHFIKLYGVDITITKFSRELRKLGHDINAKNVNGRTKRVFVN